jgi:hypothetical protein
VAEDMWEAEVLRAARLVRQARAAVYLDSQATMRELLEYQDAKRALVQIAERQRE